MVISLLHGKPKIIFPDMFFIVGAKSNTNMHATACVCFVFINNQMTPSFYCADFFLEQKRIQTFILLRFFVFVNPNTNPNHHFTALFCCA